MEEAMRELSDWAAQVQDYEPTPWERLPEIDLYMDQVITLMNKQLELFQWDEERLLTSSMINNYVKGGVLPRPSQKKYMRDHLAMLLMICMLKPVLSLPEIDETMRGLHVQEQVEQVYADFSARQGDALRAVAARICSMPEENSEALFRMAMELALEANACRTAAARILHVLKSGEDKDAKDSKKEKAKKEAPEEE